MTEALVMELGDYATSPAFSDPERTALAFAAAYRVDPDHLQTDESWAALTAVFSQAQIVELGVLCLLTTGGVPFTKALQLEDWGRVCALHPHLAKVRPST